MEFQQIDRADPEKVYAAVYNVSGTTLSAGAAAYYDVSITTPDGISVSIGGTNNKWTFAGIVKDALSDSSYGRAQVYGYCSAYAVLHSTSVSAIAGAQLDFKASKAYLQDYYPSDYFLSGAMSGANTTPNAWNFVTLMDTFASAASVNTVAALHAVFVRAM